MRHAIPLVCLFVSACLSPSVVSDPRAVGPEFDRWEVRLPNAPHVVFGAAMNVLADSGYTARHADATAGIIATNLRRVSVSGSTNDYRLDIMILPAGDSSRVVMKGEFCHVIDGAQQCYARRAWVDDWKVVQGIGEALVRKVTAESR